MDYLQIGSLAFERNASKSDMRLDFCSTLQETALDCGDLAFDTLEAEVFTNTAGPQLAALSANTPIIVYRSNEVYARFVKLTVSRIAPNSYRITGRSPMGALATMAHTGGIYAGQTVGDIVKEICGSIPVLVESVYSNQNLYGWLPYADGKEKSARDNLAQVLFATGAYLRTDLNGVLRIEKAWDGTASTIPADRSYSGGTVDYASPISSVSVTEHQYVANSDEKELFSGTTQTGDIVTFSEPMHSLTAEGFTILESNANYAKLSAGTGTLRGKTYTHNTRLVTRTVTEDAAENVISVTDATLVSLVNSVAVANRLAEYYKRRETISNGVVAGAEKPGHVVSIYHPYDKKMVSACVESLDTTMSGTIKSNLVALVGFKPPQPDAAEYFDERIILTGSGEWEVPDEVTAITAVLIGGAQGGRCGYGGNPAKLKTDNHEGAIFSIPEYITTKWAIGGKGGEGGYPGAGGKILQSTLDVTPGEKISFTCGVGGLGAAFDTNDRDNTPNTPGAFGTNTTFGLLSSSAGASSDAGYMDPVTGEVFAPTGERGIAGGDGAGMQEDVTDDNRYIPTVSGSVTDEDGNVWTGGLTRVQADGRIEATDGDEQSFTGNLKDGFVGGDVGYNCGSGAAAGANGNPGDASGSVRLTYSPSSGMPKTSITVTARGSASVNGADATLVPKKPTVYGKGGRGGYGGGGDGATGISETYYGGSKSGTRNNYEGSVRATGSNGAQGGPGADGCIILYYRRPKAVQSGPLVTSGQKWLLDSLGRRIIV